MRYLSRRIIAASVVIAVGALALVSASSAGASTTPPWEPDTQSKGTITLYDASGNVVTSGSVNSPLATYAVGSAAVRAGDVSAAVFGAQPNPSSVTGNWNVEQWTGFIKYPLTTGPAAIQTLSQTHPVATIGANDETLGQFLGNDPNSGTSGPGCAYAATAAGCTNASYQNLYQIRLQTANLGGTYLTNAYDVLDVLVSGTTWTQVYPTPPVVGPTSTITSLALSPASPRVAGTSVTLTATVSPSAAGSVQFKDGLTNIGAAVAVSSGMASISTSTLSVGGHTLTAAFTPTDATAFGPSSSSGATFVVTAPSATATTTAIGATPTSPITVGSSSTLTANVAPSTAAGSVQFFDGSTPIGAAASVSGGTATTSHTFGIGSHSLTAVFTPTDSNAFSSSTSAASVYVVNAVPASPTTTSLAVSPSGPQAFGTSVGFTATVSPSTAVGSVQFLDGTTVLATGTVSGGTATAASATLAAGTHSLTARFVPTDSTAFALSTSGATSYVVTSAASATSLAVSPSSPQQAGVVIALTATVTPSTAAGAVQFFDGSTALGSPVNVSAGSAQFSTTTLAQGNHSLTAQFNPSSGNLATSTSSAVAYTVTAPPPGSTTTALTVSPNGAATGATETLTAKVSPGTAAGTVQFTDGGANLGSAVTVTAGTAQMTVTLAQGSHSLRAAFTSMSAGFNSSTSATVPFVVSPPPTATATTLAVTPIGSALLGTNVTLSASVSPASAAGSFIFLDGSTILGTRATAGGAAVLSTVGLATGAHSLKATFSPTSTVAYQGSSSAIHSFVVSVGTAKFVAVMSGRLVLAPGAVMKAGEALSLTGSGFASGEIVKVEVHSMTTLLATTRSSATGTAAVAVTLPKTLAAGSHTLSLVGGHGTATFAFQVEATGTGTGPDGVSGTSEVSGVTAIGSGSGSGVLANTGADVLGGAGLGLALLVVGAGILFINPRRIHRGFHRTQ